MRFLLGLMILMSSQAFAKNTPYLITRYMAKEYCSCRFVVKQSPEVCKNENKTTKLFFRLREDTKNKVITVSNLVTKTQARFISPEHGCLLDKQKD